MKNREWLRVATAAWVVVGLSATAMAHETHVEDAKPRVEKRVTIIKRGEGGVPVSETEIHAARAKCKAEGRELRTEVDTSTQGKHQHTRIMICGTADADTIGALEKARGELAEEKGLSDEHRAKALAVLDAEIAREKAERTPQK